MSIIYSFTGTRAFKRHTPLRNRCRDDGVVQQPLSHSEHIVNILLLFAHMNI